MAMDRDSADYKTKYEQVAQYIRSLGVGTKISVREIARDFNISEGTAYRAIKEAENQGLVSTRRRIGTIRVEKKEVRQFDRLTFSEIVDIVEGSVLAGAEGLEKTLNKFVIGAMQLEDMMKYVEPGCLLIVGNRVQAHLGAVGRGAGILITGGFDTTPEVKELADELKLPVISSPYDTFTVATLINRAIEARLIKKKIMLVGDILRRNVEVYSLKETNTIRDMLKLMEQTGHTRYPVLDEKGRPVGVITAKDIIGAKTGQPVGQFMTRNPIVIRPDVSVSSAGHKMLWEGIELLPVVDTDGKMIGIISRKDVLKAMQDFHRQPQIGETFEVQIWSGFEGVRDEQGRLVFRGSVTPQMMNDEGTASEGILATLINRAAYRTVLEHKKGDLIVDSSSHYYLIPLQIDDEIEIVPNVIELSRRFCKIEVSVMCKGACAVRSMITARIL